MDSQIIAIVQLAILNEGALGISHLGRIVGLVLSPPLLVPSRLSTYVS